MVQGPQRPLLNAAVIGKPISHSLSPVLHAAGYQARGLPHWRYGVHEVGAEALAGFVGGLDNSWRGLSLTMPLKEVAFGVATSVSDKAQLTGAINALVRRPDMGWDAHNTDVAGLVQALAKVDHGGRAILLGSGATARSAAAALAELGVRDVTVAARTAERAAVVVSLLESLGVTARHVPLEAWAGGPARLVLSTLPPAASRDAGVYVHEAEGAFRGATLLDVVYADWPTPLARDANRAGMEVMSGFDMLVYQAAEQFDLFTGKRAPLPEMFAAGREAIGL